MQELRVNFAALGGGFGVGFLGYRSRSFAFLLAFLGIFCYNSSGMNVRIEHDGRVYSVFKGQGARVRLAKVAGGFRWLVRVRCGADGKEHFRKFALDDLRSANEYARQHDGAGGLGGLGGSGVVLRDDDLLAVRLFRAWEDEERAAGHDVPPLAVLVRDAAARWMERRRAGSFAAVVERYQTEARARSKPERGRLVVNFLDRFTAALGRKADEPCDALTDADVSAALAVMLEPTAKQSTKVHYLKVLSAVFARAIDDRVATMNPARAVLRSMPTERPAAVDFLSVEDSARLLVAARSYRSRRAALHFLIGLLCGVRMAERCRLCWGDLRLDEERPFINMPAGKAKGYHARAVYVHGTHADILRAFMPRRPRPAGELILDGYPSEERTEEAAFRVQKNIFKAAGVKHRRNVLRHTAATYLTAYLESKGAAALNLGHSETMLLQHYRGLVTHAEGVRFFGLALAPAAADAAGNYRAAAKKAAENAADSPHFAGNC